MMGKRGRKRKAGPREPNGRPQRVPQMQTEQDAMNTALTYRQNQQGVPLNVLRDQKAATLLGRLHLTGVVTEAQWQAGENWLQLVNARHALTLTPRGFRTAGGTPSTLDEDAQAERYEFIKGRFDKATKAAEGMGAVQERIARVAALSAFVVQETDDLKRRFALLAALNGLVEFFKTEPKAA